MLDPSPMSVVVVVVAFQIFTAVYSISVEEVSLSIGCNSLSELIVRGLSYQSGSGGAVLGERFWGSLNWDTVEDWRRLVSPSPFFEGMLNMMRASDVLCGLIFTVSW